MNPFELVRRVLSPWIAAPSAAEEPVDPRTPEERREKYDQDRQKLAGETRVVAVMLGVLIVLTLEYTPMVVADQQIEERYAGQVRSLVLVEGNATELDQLVDNGSGDWIARIEAHMARALRKIDELDRFNQSKASAVPKFLRDCSADEEVKGWVNARDIDPHWREIVERCIVEPLGREFERDDPNQFSGNLFGITSAMKTAVAEARVEFPGTPVPARADSCDPGQAPFAQPLAGDAISGLNGIEHGIRCVEELIELGPYAVSPAPSEWMDFYAGTTGSLRSFRDNIFFFYADPFGVAPAPLPPTRPSGRRETSVNRAPQAPDRTLISVRSSLVAPQRIGAIEAKPRTDFRFPDVSGLLRPALDQVMESQATLQAEQSARTSDVTQGFPDWLKPVAAVVRPKYLVLGYPIALAAASAYLLAKYTGLWRAARIYGYDERNVFAPLLFIALACVPVLVLIGLFRNYDWPQFAHSWWQWIYRGPLIVLVLIAFGCVFSLRYQPGKTASPPPD